MGLNEDTAQGLEKTAKFNGMAKNDNLAEVMNL